jgi:hypothetical protein
MALDPGWNGAEPELEAARREGLVSENLPSMPFMATYDDSPIAPKSMGPGIPEIPGTHSPTPPEGAFNFRPFDPIGAPTFAPVPPLPSNTPEPPVDPDAERKALAAAIKVGPDVTTEKIRRSDELTDALAARKVLGGLQASTQDRMTAHNVKVAGDVAQDSRQVIADRAEMERQARESRIRLEADQQKAKDAARELREKHSKDYEKSFFETQGTAKTWISILSVGLGAIGQGLAAAGGVRQDNLAWDVLQKMMNDHGVREKGRLLRQKEEIERRGEDVSRIDQQLKDFDTITMPQMRTALLEKAKERRESLLAQHGASKEQIDGDVLKQKIQEQSLKDTITVETQLADRVRVSNENQNQLKRQMALQTAKGKAGADKPLTEGERKGVATIGGAMNALQRGLDNTKDLDKKDKAIFRKIENEARTLKESDPAKAWAAFAQLGGRYYDQLSDNGSRRLRAFENYFRDLERNTSGAVIGPAETMGHIAEAIEPGGVKYAIDRARAFAPLAGRGESGITGKLDSFEKNASTSGTRQQATTKAEAVQLLRTSRDPSMRAALEWAANNPGDPRSSAILDKVKAR